MHRFQLSRAQKLIFGVACALMFLGTSTLVTSQYLSNSKKEIPIVYSKNALLYELWNDYKVTMLEPNTYRTLDKNQNNITTSEGQSYTMLRAVWMDDKETFDKSWAFTKDNMQREDDGLMSWKFGQREDGSYGILTDGSSQNAASDADVDIAHSLLMAYSRWNATEYLDEAKKIITSIWDKEVVEVNGQHVLLANDIERHSKEDVIINPSYFAPYAYRLFAKVDEKHNWLSVVDSSYKILNDLSISSLNTGSTAGLPPNWIIINRTTGEYKTPPGQLDTHYGYDAMRIPWRIALDYEWNGEQKAKELLDKFSFLEKEWNENRSLRAVYSHDGQIIDDYETPAMYGTAIGYFIVSKPELAVEVFEEKLQTLYTPDKQQWKTELSYYDDNWAWFGIALAQKSLPNLAEINN